MARFFFVVLYFLPFFVVAQEICNNGIDDDGDLLIDLNDTTDCACDVFSIGNLGVPSIIPNSSFEDTLCCPTGFTQLFCADVWSQATLNTSDFFYSTCGYNAAFLPPLTANNGNGYAGAIYGQGNDEYIGACLLSPMLTGTSYSLNMDVYGQFTDGFGSSIIPINYPPIDIVIYGHVSCPTWPVPTSACPLSNPNGWSVIATYNHQFATNWQNIQITFTPTFDVEAIMIGPPCTYPATWPAFTFPFYPYLFYDNLTMNDSALFLGGGFDQTGSICNNDLVITALLDSVVGSYQWFQNGVAIVGQTDTILNLSALGLLPDTFQFQQTLNVDSCVITQVIVAPAVYPNVTFSATPTAGCAPLTVNFDNTVDPALVATSIWDMGNGTTFNAIDTTYTFTQPGSYDITLQITTPDGCVSDTTIFGYINVDALPIVEFTADTTEGCEPQLINFTNTTANAANCAWNFGNGTISGACNASATYLSAGTYDVQLTITTAQGCVNDSTAVAIITIHPTPIPDFTGFPLSGCVPVNTQFNNTTSNTPIASCTWDFGDGTASVDCNPLHSYTNPGTYDVQLSVVSNFGCVADTTFLSYIEGFGYPDPTFTADPIIGCWPLDVDFAFSNLNPFSVSSVDWDFGDGNTLSQVLNNTHTYNYTDTFDVAVTITDINGCTSDTTVQQMIITWPHPQADFTFTPTETSVYQPLVSFFNQASSDVLSWQWIFDGTYPVGQQFIPSPVVVFPEDGRGDYDIYQIVTNQFGCVDTSIAMIHINGAYNQFVPNAFTPNGDGYNDVFVPIVSNVDLDQYEFYVFNRWGEEIFYSTTPLQGWDGTFKGKPVKSDVYVWRLVTRNVEAGNKESRLGHVTLVK